MQITKTLYLTTRNKWRAWLQKNHDKEKEIWLVYYKKHTLKARIAYNDAVEEALCFGWIDSTVKGIDEDSFAQRFSPRNKRSNWSESNKERVRRLIEQEKMTPAGLELFGKEKSAQKDSLNISVDIFKALKKDAKT